MALFDGKKISLITRKSNTIDNVKTNIDNVKIQDEVD
jgi:Asp/Glu/hydantoin racemase